MNKGRALRLAACAALLVATVITPAMIAGAATQTFVAVADAQVVKDSPSTNFGGSTSFAADRSPVVESYLRFDVSGLTGSVQKVTLRLYASNGTNNGPGVYTSDALWNETGSNGITWNNRPARGPVKLANAGPVSAPAWLELDVTAAVPRDGTYSFNIVGDSKDEVIFHSKEAANKPELVVTLAPPDTTPPETTITSGPSGTVNMSSVSFSFSSSEANSTFECRLNSDPFVACTSPQSYPDLADGNYTFQVRATDPEHNTDASPAQRTFKVDTVSIGDPVLVGAGDIASCSSSGDEATAALLDGISGTVFTAGDNVYDTGTAAEFTNCYNPSWGRHLSRTKPAPGNHDYGIAGATGYYGYFGPAAGDPAKGYYSYNLGAWHVIVLNSNCTKVGGGCGAGSPQEQWLRADLAASNAACTVAMWHHPRFSSGSVHGSDATYTAFWQALYDFGADVAIVGHDHLYERLAPQTPAGAADTMFGIRQFTVGTGGRSHYAPGTRVANSEVLNGDTYGVLKLTLHATGFDWQFVPEAGKAFTDSGNGACHDAPPATPPPPPPPPTSGPIAFRAASSAGSPTAQGSITIPKPAGTLTGDVMVASIVINDDDPPITTPVGWTPVRQDALTNAVMQAVFVRVAGSGEPNSYTWALSTATTRRITGGISSYSGVDTSNPIEAQGGATDAAGSTSITAPSITTVTAGAMLVELAAINAEGTIAAPAGHTERWENNAFNSTGTRDALAESSDAVQVSAGATGTRTAIASLPGPNIGVLIALRPAPAG